MHRNFPPLPSMTEPEPLPPSTPASSEVELGRRLREYRVRAGLDLKSAAQASGVSAVSIQKYETARRTPTAHRLAALAEVYATSIDTLMGRPRGPHAIYPGKVLVDRRRLEGLLRAKNCAEALPYLNWRPGMFLALVEVPEGFELVGAQEAMDLAVEARQHLQKIAPRIVEAYEENQVAWEAFGRDQLRALGGDPEKI